MNVKETTRDELEELYELAIHTYLEGLSWTEWLKDAKDLIAKQRLNEIKLARDVPNETLIDRTDLFIKKEPLDKHFNKRESRLKNDLRPSLDCINKPQT